MKIKETLKKLKPDTSNKKINYIVTGVCLVFALAIFSNLTRITFTTRN